MEDYTKRTPNAEGTHVHIVQHKEWVEKIRQPPTAEEIAQRRKDNKIIAGIFGGLVGLGVLAFGGLIYADEKKRRKQTTVS